MKTAISTRILLVDGNQGRYVPQIFMQRWYEFVTNISDVTHSTSELETELKDQLSNPDNEFYWGAWEEILDTSVLSINGNSYKLEQEDGDLWAVIC